MPTIEDFIAELRGAGVIINETGVRRQARECSTWSTRLADLARSGRKQGIAFLRARGSSAGNSARL